MATDLLGFSSNSAAWSVWTCSTVARPLARRCLSRALWVAGFAGARDCHLCTSVLVLLVRLVWKHQHFSGSVGDSAPSHSPNKKNQLTLQLASSARSSLFSGAVYVVSNFRCSKPSCVTPLCLFWPWLHQSDCTDSFAFISLWSVNQILCGNAANCENTSALSIKRLTCTTWLLFISVFCTDYPSVVLNPL